MVMEMNIGERIAELRNKNNMTQDYLAQKLFVTNKTISSWESNRTEPSLEMVIKLSDILGCTATYLIHGNTSKSDIETEIKIKLTKSEYESLKAKLKLKAKYINEHTQLDIYYEPSHRRFLKDNTDNVEEWLRIGIRGNKKILNYKHWYDNKYCDEYEVEIDDEENLNKIFNILGLKEIVRVNKKRETYMYLDKYEIVLDSVENLGYFTEIEVKKYNKKALEEYESLLRVAKELDLNLDNIDKRGYPYHLIYNDLDNKEESSES